MKPGKSVLLYGPRGTGKTSLVEAVAHSTGELFVFVLVYMGTTARIPLDAVPY